MTSSYYVGTAGSVSAETILKYIVECQGKLRSERVAFIPIPFRGGDFPLLSLNSVILE